MWGLTPEVVFGALGILGGVVTFAFWAGAAWQRWRGETDRSRQADKRLRSDVETLKASGTDEAVVRRLKGIERRLGRLEDFQDALIEQTISDGGALRLGRREGSSE